MKLEICVDVDDVERAMRFYGDGIGLEVVKKEADWGQLRAGDLTIWIMKIPAGKSGAVSRQYSRHWTPVHLDIHVDDIEAAIKRASAAGGKLEGRPKPTLANFSDPAGNGVDLVQAS